MTAVPPPGPAEDPPADRAADWDGMETGLVTLALRSEDDERGTTVGPGTVDVRLPRR
jgi:hypothetical protein